MHVDQRILQQQHTPQGNCTILPTEAANLPTETVPGGHPPNSPLSAGSDMATKYDLLGSIQ